MARASAPSFTAWSSRAPNFDFFIAGQAGVGGFPGHVGGNKIIHHIALEDFFQVKDMDGKSQLRLQKCDVHGLGLIPCGKMDAENLWELLFDQIACDQGVHPSAQGHGHNTGQHQANSSAFFENKPHGPGGAGGNAQLTQAALVLVENHFHLRAF